MSVFDYFENQVTVVKANMKNETATVITKKGERLIQPFKFLVSDGGINEILEEAEKREGLIR